METDDAPPMTLRQRIIVALCFGLLIGLIAAQAAWQGSSIGYATHGPSFGTHLILRDLAGSITDFQAEKKALPDDLAAISARERERLTREREQQVTASAAHFSHIRNGVVYDGWKNPIIYTHEGDTFTVTSFGSDGQAGGEGIATDLTYDKSGDVTKAQRRQLGFVQWWTIPAGGRMALFCGVTGMFSGLLCFFLLRKSLGKLLLPGIATILATLFVNLLMGLSDIVKWH